MDPRRSRDIQQEPVWTAPPPIAIVTSLVCAFVLVGQIAPRPARADESRTCTGEPTTMAIAYGQTVGCGIEVPGDTDLFFFQGSSGDTVLARLTLTGGYSGLCFKIIAPDQSEQTSCAYYDPLKVWTLDQTGIWSILVSAQYGDTIGYTLALERVAPAANPVRFGYGDNTVGYINPGGDVDLFELSGTLGDHALLSVTPLECCYNPLLTLFSPTGTQVAGPTSSSVDKVLTESGTFSVIVYWESNLVSPATAAHYSLNSQCIGGPCLLNIFADGFELGTVCRWHTSVPPAECPSA